MKRSRGSTRAVVSVLVNLESEAQREENEGNAGDEEKCAVSPVLRMIASLRYVHLLNLFKRRWPCFIS